MLVWSVYAHTSSQLRKLMPYRLQAYISFNPEFTLILDQGESGEDPVIINNQGQPNESYQLQQVSNTLSVSVPSIGIIVQY